MGLRVKLIALRVWRLVTWGGALVTPRWVHSETVALCMVGWFHYSRKSNFTDDTRDYGRDCYRESLAQDRPSRTVGIRPMEAHSSGVRMRLGGYQNETIHGVKKNQPIPDITSEITTDKTLAQDKPSRVLAVKYIPKPMRCICLVVDGNLRGFRIQWNALGG